MKLKSLALTGMAAALVFAAAPLMAEEDMEQMGMGDMQMDQMQMLSDSGMGAQNDMNETQANDETKENGSPDTATGDDDY